MSIHILENFKSNKDIHICAHFVYETTKLETKYNLNGEKTLFTMTSRVIKGNLLTLLKAAFSSYIHIVMIEHYKLEIIKRYKLCFEENF